MSLKSMTAYGSGTSESSELTVTSEIKSLNSRFIEVNVRLPRGFMAAEPELIRLVKSKLKRGKVDISIDLQYQHDTSKLPTLDLDAVKHYASLIDTLQSTLQTNISSSFSALREPSPYDMFKLEGVLSTKKKLLSGSEKEITQIKEAVSLALDKIIEARSSEGEALKGAFIELIEQIKDYRSQIVGHLPEIRILIEANYQKKIEKAVAELSDKGFKADMPPEERIMGELAILVDKADIEEELTRLDAHCVSFLELLDIGDGMGRKLDFLCQELHREVNTISSKLHQSSVSAIVLDLKQTVEKIRQQVQNIE